MKDLRLLFLLLRTPSVSEPDPGLPNLCPHLPDVEAPPFLPIRFCIRARTLGAPYPPAFAGCGKPEIFTPSGFVSGHEPRVAPHLPALGRCGNPEIHPSPVLKGHGFQPCREEPKIRGALAPAHSPQLHGFLIRQTGVTSRRVLTPSRPPQLPYSYWPPTRYPTARFTP